MIAQTKPKLPVFGPRQGLLLAACGCVLIAIIVASRYVGVWDLWHPNSELESNNSEFTRTQIGMLVLHGPGDACRAYKYDNITSKFSHVGTLRDHGTGRPPHYRRTRKRIASAEICQQILHTPLGAANPAPRRPVQLLDVSRQEYDRTLRNRLISAMHPAIDISPRNSHFRRSPNSSMANPS